MNKQNRFTDTENKLTVAREQEELKEWVKKVKGLRSTDWYLIVLGTSSTAQGTQSMILE